jgi:hypothetical protein
MNKKSKDFSDFARKFRNINIDSQFKDIISKNETFKNDLFNEFVKTIQIPDFSLYLESFITEKEYNEGMDIRFPSKINGSTNIIAAANHIPFTEFEKKVYKIIDDFNTQTVKGALKKSYYSFDLDSTRTIKILKDIHSELSALKSSISNSEDISQYDRDAKAFAFSVYSLLAKLENNELMHEIAELITNGEDLMLLPLFFLESDKKGGDRDLYSRKKRLFNLHLSEFITLSPNLANSTSIVNVGDSLNSGKQFYGANWGRNIDDQGQTKSVVTVESVAAMCYYLKQAGFFKGGRINKQIDEIRLKYGYRFNSLYNKMYNYEDEHERAKQVSNIKKAVALMRREEEFNLGGAIAMALAHIEIIEKANHL